MDEDIMDSSKYKNKQIKRTPICLMTNYSETCVKCKPSEIPYIVRVTSVKNDSNKFFGKLIDILCKN